MLYFSREVLLRYYTNDLLEKFIPFLSYQMIFIKNIMEFKIHLLRLIRIICQKFNRNLFVIINILSNQFSVLQLTVNSIRVPSSYMLHRHSDYRYTVWQGIMSCETTPMLKPIQNTLRLYKYLFIVFIRKPLLA